MVFDDVLKSRRSIRKFLNTPIKKDAIREIINAARLSPSAKNRQPWRFVYLEPKAKETLLLKMRAIAERANAIPVLQTVSILETAPAIIAVYALGQSYSDTLSLGAAMYTMCLKATDLDIGSLWVGDTDVLKSEKEYADLAGVVALGYPAEMPPARYRKSLEEVSNLTYENKRETVEDRIENADLENTEYVFISYSHRDEECVKTDIVELKKFGLPLWYDKGISIGEKWDKKALENLKNPRCKVFLWYISESSLASDPVYKELRTALKKKSEMTIIPVLIGGKSVSSLISTLSRKRMYKKAAFYKKYFGRGSETLYIQRSSTPRKLSHLEVVMNRCRECGIVEKSSIYDNYLYEIRSGKAIIKGYTGVAAEIAVPESICGFPVTETAESAFAENTFIKKVILPNTMKVLGLGTFRHSTLSEIYLPESIIEIQTACFRDCECLEHVKLPSGITYLSEALFRGCTGLKSVEIPARVKEMKEAVFNTCCSIEEITLPDSLAVMTEGGFFGCASLKRLNIPSTVVGAEIGSFNTCPLLERVKLGGFIFEKGKGVKEH